MAKRAVPPIATCAYNSTQTATLQPKSNQSKRRKEREKLEKQEDKSESQETSAGNSARHSGGVLDVRGTLWGIVRFGVELTAFAPGIVSYPCRC